MSTDADIIIIGAGLTGLNAAITAQSAGASILLIDRDKEPGGRMKTERQDGFVFDRGFQIILDSYSELERLNILPALNTKPFWAGAKIRYQGEVYTLLDPRRHPSNVFTLFARPPPFLRISDAPKLLKLYLESGGEEPRALNISTHTLLEQRGFSAPFREGFFTPFFSGVLLDPTLSADAGLLKFLLAAFARGNAVLARDGATALPTAMCNRLPANRILLDRSVESVTTSSVTLEGGEQLSCRAVICACDVTGAIALGAPIRPMEWLATTTLYFEAPASPYNEPLLFLDADRTGPINHLAVLTNVQPAWSERGSSLVSCSVVGPSALSPESKLLPAATRQLTSLFGEQVIQWLHLRTVRVPKALPAQPALGPGWIEHAGVFFAGDYLSYGSQNGSLAAGRRVSDEVLRRLAG